MNKIKIGEYKGEAVSISEFVLGDGIYVWLGDDIAGIFTVSELIGKIDNDIKIWDAIEEVYQRVDDLSQKCGKN